MNITELVINDNNNNRSPYFNVVINKQGSAIWTNAVVVKSGSVDLSIPLEFIL